MISIICIHYMAKLYSKKKLAPKKMLPKKETISFLLNYSKALSITKVGKLSFEFIKIGKLKYELRGSKPELFP